MGHDGMAQEYYGMGQEYYGMAHWGIMGWGVYYYGMAQGDDGMVLDYGALWDGVGALWDGTGWAMKGSIE